MAELLIDLYQNRFTPQVATAADNGGCEPAI
jgi:hypothetical protein